MKRLLWLSLVLTAACQKELNLQHEAAPSNSFKKYMISKGNHYADNVTPSSYMGTTLKFTVRFDSSAIYQTADPQNQADINKLYGFSDDNRQHHEYSARIGWRWYNNELTLHAYVYNNGSRQHRQITTVEPGKDYHCSITVKQDMYIFYVNEKQLSVQRKATGQKASGYKLFPYFGGDEPAPHNICIWIQEDK